MIADKKRTERHILEKFISNARLELRITSVDNGGEPPDFIITTFEKKRVSVELTSLINPELKEEEEFQSAIVNRAWEFFKEKYKVALEVHVTFAGNRIVCKRSEIDMYAKQVFEVVERAYIPMQHFGFRASSRHTLNLGRNIDSLYISNQDNFDNWQTFGTYIVEKINFNWIKEKVAEKEKALERYCGQAEEKWLVLVSTFGTKSSAYHFDYLNFTELHTKFDKVYAYKYFEDKVIEIKAVK